MFDSSGTTSLVFYPVVSPVTLASVSLVTQSVWPSGGTFYTWVTKNFWIWFKHTLLVCIMLCFFKVQIWNTLVNGVHTKIFLPCSCIKICFKNDMKYNMIWDMWKCLYCWYCVLWYCRYCWRCYRKGEHNHRHWGSDAVLTTNEELEARSLCSSFSTLCAIVFDNSVLACNGFRTWQTYLRPFVHFVIYISLGSQNRPCHTP